MNMSFWNLSITTRCKNSAFTLTFPFQASTTETGHGPRREDPCLRLPTVTQQRWTPKTELCAREFSLPWSTRPEIQLRQRYAKIKRHVMLHIALRNLQLTLWSTLHYQLCSATLRYITCNFLLRYIFYVTSKFMLRYVVLSYVKIHSTERALY